MSVEIKDLVASNKKNSEAIETLTKSLSALTDKLKTTPALNEQSIYGGRNVRTGEDPLSSRGFSFCKMLGVLSGACDRDKAKVELDVANRLDQVYCKSLGNAGYTFAGGTPDRRFLAPMATNLMHEDFVPRSFRSEMKGLVNAGCEGADSDEMGWIRTKMLQARGYGSKALSWLNELTGGAIVQPPEQGEIIELLRNKEALINAGARVIPLPPQGRLKYPRQTAASTTYWVGENSPITESLIGTGEVTLQAKKLACLIKAPNELIRFASPAAEALMRDDMTKSMALALDLAGLEGLGGDSRPRGLLNIQGIQRITAGQTGQNGDRLMAGDIYRMIAAVEEANAEFEGFVMRPKTLYKLFQLRGDAVMQGDSQGVFLFSMIRDAADTIGMKLAGYPVTKSTQVSQVRTKGTNSNLTYLIGGMWSDLLIGMFGAMEFASTTVGDTAFVNDQTWVRAILSADIAVRHDSAFCYLDNIDITQ
jgi:HK97 family phage major capsid protein